MNINYAGASTIGKAHRELGQENQDSFMIERYKFGVVMVVADGLGSKKHSKTGSREVCNAVAEATKIWIKRENAPIENLIKLIHNIWQILIIPKVKEECSTTCLFCIYLNTGKVVLGQLGDGLICYYKNELLEVLSEKEEEFLNMTNSMSSARSVEDWDYKQFTLEQNEIFSLFMTTDGLSEDIYKEKRKEFIIFLTDKINKKCEQKKKNRILKNIIKKCEGKYNCDDKTIIIFNRGE